MQNAAKAVKYRVDHSLAVDSRDQCLTYGAVAQDGVLKIDGDGVKSVHHNLLEVRTIGVLAPHLVDGVRRYRGEEIDVADFPGYLTDCVVLESTHYYSVDIRAWPLEELRVAG